MKIGIDLRSLQGGDKTGVENYTFRLTESLLSLDYKNQYVLFHNGRNTSDMEDMHFINSRQASAGLPNRLLNLMFMSGLKKMENYFGEVDWLFMPNLNQFCLRPETRLALTVHDLSPVVTPEFYDMKRRLWHKLLFYRKSFLRANLLFTVSEYTKYDLTRIFGVDKDKIRVVYPGTESGTSSTLLEDNNLRLLRNTLGLPGEYLLFLGTLEPRKNLAGLLEAFACLRSEAYLVIAGKPGWKYKPLLKKIANHPKKHLIRYLGYIPEKDKAGLIKMASLLVYPSFYEGFGFQPLEAACLGTPIIASAVTSLPEIWQDAALLVNPYNTDELCEAMEFMLNDEDLKCKLREKAGKKAAHFSWKKSASQILEALRNNTT